MTHRILGYVAVFIGGAFGSALRHAVNQTAATLFGMKLPWGTFAVNILGSIAIGLITGWFAFRGGTSNQIVRLFVTTGVVGGFTTFSAFALDTALMWERGQQWTAALYGIGSVLLSVAGIFLTMGACRYVFAR